MNRIFISYSRTDEEFARRLAADLDRDGVDVWIDVEDIPSGANWSNAVNDGLNKADLMLLVLSPQSVTSQNVEDEWQFFHNQRKPIIPVQLEPGGRLHYQLTRLQYVDFYQREYESAYDALLLEMRRLGFEVERLSETIAKLESQRLAAEAERQRLQREVDALRQATAERDRLRAELENLQRSETERQRVENELRRLRRDEQAYANIKAAEAKRRTEDIPIVKSQVQSQMEIKSTPRRDTGKIINQPQTTLARKSAGFWGLPAATGVIILGVVGILLIIALVYFSGILGGNGDDDPTDIPDTSSSPDGPKTLETALVLGEKNAPTSRLIWDPNDEFLLAVGDNKNIQVWQIYTEPEFSETPIQLSSEETYTLPAILEARWTSTAEGENYLAFLDDDPALTIWKLTPGVSPDQHEVIFYEGVDNAFWAGCNTVPAGLSWHGWRPILAYGCDTEFYVLEVDSGNINGAPLSHNISHLDWSPANELIAVVEDGLEAVSIWTIECWMLPDEESETECWNLGYIQPYLLLNLSDIDSDFANGEITALAWHRSQPWLAVAGVDSDGAAVIQIWIIGIDENNQVFAYVDAYFIGHEAAITALDWAYDDSKLASVDSAGQLFVWDYEADDSLVGWGDGDYPYQDVVWRVNNAQIATVGQGNNSQVELWTAP